MLRLLLPAYQHAAKPIEPTMTAFDDPAPCPLARFTGDLLRFLAATANVRREANFAQGCAHVVIIVAFIQSHALRSLLRRRRSLHDHALDGRTHQVHIVAIGAINRHPDGHAMPLGQHRPLDACFPEIGRIGAGCFLSERRPGHRPVYTQPVPVSALQFIERFDADLPQFQEHAGGDPCATSVIRRGYGAQIRLVQRRLLTTGAEDVKDDVGAAAIRHARTTAAKPMGVHRERAQGRFQYGPQVVRDAKARRGHVVWCARTRALGC